MKYFPSGKVGIEFNWQNYVVLKNQSPFWSKPSLERSFSFVVIWYCTTISFSGVLLKKLFTWPLLWANNFRFKLWGLSWVILLFFSKRDFYLQWNTSGNLCTSFSLAFIIFPYFWRRYHHYYIQFNDTPRIRSATQFGH